MTETNITHSPEETEAYAASLAEKARKCGCVCLYGGLGAGKTAFTRGLVRALIPECLPLVHSPTFAIVNEYLGKSLSIFHFDLYRIKDEDDLWSTGFFDYADRGGIVVTEWSENFTDALPADAMKVVIEATGETERKITVSC